MSNALDQLIIPSIRKTPEAKAELKCIPLSTVRAREIAWLWKSRIPAGTLSNIEGEGGRGKSTLIAELCSKWSTGERLHDDDTDRSPMRILLLVAEDDPECVLKPRFERHGANCENIFFDDQAMILNESGLEALADSIKSNKIDVVVIDPIVAFLGARLDMNKGNDVRSVLGPLVRLGRETGCTFIVVRHFNKSREGSASQKGAGSVDFRNAARSVLQVIRANDKTYVALEKSNYAGKAPALSFNIENGTLIWGDASDLSADDLLSDSQSKGDSHGALDEAIAFLKSELVGGAKLATEITKSARDLGLATKTLQRAKDRLKVESVKQNSQWYWRVKRNDAKEHGQGGQAGQTLRAGNLGHLGYLGHLESDSGQQETLI